jgi:hypothetical protein
MYSVLLTTATQHFIRDVTSHSSFSVWWVDHGNGPRHSSRTLEAFDTRKQITVTGGANYPEEKEKSKSFLHCRGQQSSPIGSRDVRVQ